MGVTRFTLGKNCPTCKHDRMTRIHRKWWMRLIVGSKRFRCDKCGTTLLTYRTEKAEEPPYHVV